MLGQAQIELSHQGVLIIPGIIFIEKPIQSLVVKALPGLFLLAWINGIEQRKITLGCLEVAGSITNHQNAMRLVFGSGSVFDVFSLGPHFLPRNHGNHAIDLILPPLPLKGVYGCL